MTAADITWDSYAWPPVWLADTDALSVPAPNAAAEPPCVTPSGKVLRRFHVARG